MGRAHESRPASYTYVPLASRLFSMAVVARSVTAEARFTRSETRLAAHAEIARALSESTSAASATCGVMKAIGENLGWACAFFWSVGEGGHLRVKERWLGEDAIAPFADATENTSFAPEQGLPGRVWSSGEPAWIDRIEADPNFVRLEVASPLAATIAVQVGAARVVVESGFDRALLRAVVEALS